MTARHKVSSAALELIKRFEGYRRKAARLADGRWTIGYGHTLTAREGAEVSPDDAEALLLYDVRPVAAAVDELIYTPLTQNQFDALVAFAFNVGVDNFRRSSVLRRVNEGALIQAACALEMWRKADFEGERIVVDALVRRRAAEKTLFLTPTNGWIPAPSPILRPKVDYDVGQSLPKSSTELETSMTGDVAEAHRASEGGSASVAAADALTERMNRLLPEPEEVPPVQPEQEQPLEPAPTLEPIAAVARQPEPVTEPERMAEPEAAHPTYTAEAVGVPAFLAAPALFNTLFGGEPTASQEPTETAPVIEPVSTATLAEVHEHLEPTSAPVPEPAAFTAVEPAHVEFAPVAEPESEFVHDSRFEIPDREPVDLARRVVWREASTDTEASRLLGGGLSGMTPLLLVVLFLAGLAVFAGGIVWGLNAKGSGVISWVLGLVGIVCVVSAVYIYLERLGGRED